MHHSQCKENAESFPLPKGWPENARHAVLNVIGIVRVVMLRGREFLIQNGNVLEAHVRRLETDVALLRTAVPISGGFWTHWLPNALSQRWPVCWWQLNIVDHFSKRAMGFAVFKTRPTSEEVTAAFDEIIEREQAKPKHLIVDQGPEFNSEHFEDKWCEQHGILPRFGPLENTAASPWSSDFTEPSKTSYG